MTFIIRHKETKDKWISMSGKSSWKAIGHAKSAWANHHQGWPSDLVKYNLIDSGITPKQISKKDFRGNTRYYYSNKFDDQDVYEVVELFSDQDILLKDCLNMLEKISNDSIWVEEINDLLKRGGR